MMAGHRRWLRGRQHRVVATALCSLLMIATSASAQNTFPASGNVGIGTVNPTTKLHVYGASPLLMMESSNDQGAGYFLKNRAQQWYFGFLDNAGITRWSLYDV